MLIFKIELNLFAVTTNEQYLSKVYLNVLSFILPDSSFSYATSWDLTANMSTNLYKEDNKKISAFENLPFSCLRGITVYNKITTAFVPTHSKLSFLDIATFVFFIMCFSPSLSFSIPVPLLVCLSPEPVFVNV